jgi:S1-C subfamily serine protease
VLNEQEELLLGLAKPWLTSSKSPVGLEAEHRKVLQVEQARSFHEAARDQARATLFPADRAGRARLGASCGFLAAALVAGAFLLFLTGSTGSPDADGAVVAAAGNPGSEPGPAAEKTKQPDPPKPSSPKVAVEKPPAKKTLKQLFSTLSPAVPVVEIPGAGGGSGFLVRHEGCYLIVTNRHVIELASLGLNVYFLRTTRPGQEERLQVPKDKVKLVAVHREVDLALIDVSPAAPELAAWGIQPVPLAKSDFVASVGDHVFAIGHPGDAAGGLLTRTLSDGIVSAVNRKDRYMRGYLTQVTVAINPGNSGGPIFNDEGEVIAVATFTIRRDSRLGGPNLEALNFGLDTRHIHELLNEPEKSMPQAHIAALFGAPKPPTMPAALVARMEAKLKNLKSKGYELLTGDLKTSIISLQLPGDHHTWYTLPRLSAQDQYHIFVVSQGSGDMDLHIMQRNGNVLARDIRIGRDKEVSFQPLFAGEYFLCLRNLTELPADAIVVLLKR